MTEYASALYVGEVSHRRLRPKRHALRYRTYAMLIDLDELPALARSLRLFSRNRFNMFSFHDRDYGIGEAVPLRAQIEHCMREAGSRPEGGAIRLLTMPRVLGYAFNPLSLYFCHGRDGALSAILYEVNNTFGQRHSYFLPVDGTSAGPIRQTCVKQFYVSPFMAMDMAYEFVVTPPGESLSVTIIERDREGVILTATQKQRRIALTDGALARLFFSHPLLTLKVIGGIHFEAALLWAKGLRVEPRPVAPDRPVTIQSPIRGPSPPSALGGR
jgi:uncharacterized protein